jgi:hypothetical protein
MTHEDLKAVTVVNKAELDALNQVADSADDLLNTSPSNIPAEDLAMCKLATAVQNLANIRHQI